MAYSRCPQPTGKHKTAISSIVSIAKKRQRSFSQEDAQQQTSVSLKSGPGCGNFKIHVSSEFNYQKPPPSHSLCNRNQFCQTISSTQ